jgi:hypothetical protein
MPYHLSHVVILGILAIASWDDSVQIAYQPSDNQYIIIRVALRNDFEIT